MERILDEVHDEYDGTEFRRVHLLRRKDLYNICRDFNITYTKEQHEYDGASVKAWVEEMGLLQDASPVLYFKEQGIEDIKSGLRSEDFVLIIMTPFQKEQLIRFGNEKICVHGTHVTNEYDFQLCTMLTVDECGAGYPVAFCISNRCDEILFKVFFSNVQCHAGIISPTVFMSDDAPFFYNAWASIMGSVPHHLICAWDVDRNWRQQLARISGSMEKKTLIYKTLRVLMKDCVVDKFKELLQQVVEDLYADAETHKFGEYFDKHYAKHPQKWAYCFRQHLGINTNMYLESLRKQLKHVYLEGKKPKKLEKTIHELLILTRDCMFTRMVELAENASSDRILKIQEEHERSQEIPTSSIKHEDGSTEWIVQSSSNSDVEYVVQKVPGNCERANCNLQCNVCNVCVHTFKCSCVDSVINFNICKHIHACAAAYFSDTNTYEDEGIIIEEIVIQELTELDDVWEICEPDEHMVSNSAVIRSKIEVLLGLNLAEEEYALVSEKLDELINVMQERLPSTLPTSA